MVALCAVAGQAQRGGAAVGAGIRCGVVPGRRRRSRRPRRPDYRTQVDERGSAGVAFGGPRRSRATSRADVTFEVRPVCRRRGVTAPKRGTAGDENRAEQRRFRARHRERRTTRSRSPRPDRVRQSRAAKRTSPCREADESAGNADKIRRLLADSRAVLRFRGVSARCSRRTTARRRRSRFIMADATVGMLTGDVGRAPAHRAVPCARCQEESAPA